MLPGLLRKWCLDFVHTPIVLGDLIFYSFTHLDPEVVTGKWLHQRGRLTGRGQLCSATLNSIAIFLQQIVIQESCCFSLQESASPDLLLSGLIPFRATGGIEFLSISVGVGTPQVAFGSRLKTCCVVCCRNDSGDHSDHMHYYQVGSSSWGVFVKILKWLKKWSSVLSNGCLLR